MKIGEYEQMMAYLTRPGFKDGTEEIIAPSKSMQVDTTTKGIPLDGPLMPEPKPYTSEQFKLKADLYIKGALGGFDKGEMINLLQEQLDKVQASGTMEKEEAIKFIQERTKLLKDFIKENPGETLPSLETREEFSEGTPDIKQILRNMAEDRTYEPPINLAAKGRGLPPGFRKAKQELRKEIPDFDDLYNRNLTYRKKQKLKQKMIDNPEFKQTEMAKKAERRRIRRAGKLGDKTSLTPGEKLLNYKQSLITRQLNDKIKNNPDLILKNKNLMDQLSTTISKDGNIIKVKPNLSQLKERGIFEIEHQRDIYKEGKMKDFPYNRNLIMAPHNRAGGFKQMAESFIEKNPDSPKIDAILKKAEELKITLQPNVPQGTFKTKGIGYKQTPDAVQKFINVASSLTPNLVDEKIGVPEKNIGMIKKALGFKKLTNIPGVTTADKIDRPEKAKLLEKFRNFGKPISKIALRAVSPFIPIVGTAGTLMGMSDVAEASTFTKKPDELGIAYLAGPEVARNYGSFKESIRGKADETEEFVP